MMRKLYPLWGDYVGLNGKINALYNQVTSGLTMSSTYKLNLPTRTKMVDRYKIFERTTNTS